MKKSKYIELSHPLYLRGIAHRGLHDDKYTENSSGAFKQAIEKGYAFEFDVHLTKDNNLIICHDSDLERVTGKKGIIEELSVKEIKENYKLLDGSVLITLKELLDMTQEKVPFVLEIKPTKKNQKAIALRVVEELKVIKDKKNVTIISFYPGSLKYVRKYGYLTQLLIHRTRYIAHIAAFMFNGIDIDKVLYNKKWVKRYHKHHFVNTWTIQSQEELDNVRPYVDTFTFENFIPKE